MTHAVLRFLSFRPGPTSPVRLRWASARALLLPVFWMSLSALPAAATEVEVVAITPGRSAAVVIDGAPPITIGVGETVNEVTLVDVGSDSARLRIDGIVRTLGLSAIRGGNAHLPSMDTLSLTADGRGHFVTDGAINGRNVRLLVDTGASYTTLSRAEADRIGVRYRNGQRTALSTANGMVGGWRVRLDSVRLGKVTVRSVEAVVVDSSLNTALLGMSFLNSFDLERRGNKLLLRRRR